MKWPAQSVSGLRSRSGEKSSVLVFRASTVKALDLEDLDVRFRYKDRLFFAAFLNGCSRCKVDIEIAAMDGGDEPQAVRSTDHWHAIASGLVCASSALTGGPWGVSQSADFFFAEIALPSVVRRSASVCFTDTPR